MRSLQLVRKGGPWHYLAGYNCCIQGINWQQLLGGDCNSLAHSTDVCRRKMAIYRQTDLSAEVQQKIDLHSFHNLILLILYRDLGLMPDYSPVFYNASIIF